MALDDERVRMRRLLAWDPSPASTLDSAAGRTLQRVVREVFPGAIAVPVLSGGATDARRFVPLAANTYRFIPFPLTQETMKLAHAANERVPMEACGRAVRFYRRLLMENR